VAVDEPVWLVHLPAHAWRRARASLSRGRHSTTTRPPLATTGIVRFTRFYAHFHTLQPWPTPDMCPPLAQTRPDLPPGRMETQTGCCTPRTRPTRRHLTRTRLPQPHFRPARSTLLLALRPPRPAHTDAANVALGGHRLARLAAAASARGRAAGTNSPDSLSGESGRGLEGRELAPLARRASEATLHSCPCRPTRSAARRESRPATTISPDSLGTS